MLRELKCTEFIDMVASSEPAPGGGAVVSLSGALGAALNAMVCNITLNKQNEFTDYSVEIDVLKKTLAIQENMMKLIDKDAECYTILAGAYRLPRNTEQEKSDRTTAIQVGLLVAAQPPLEMLDLCIEAINLHEIMKDRCSKMIISDIGVGVQCLRSAILGTHLNILINANSITNERLRSDITDGLDVKIKAAVDKCDKIYEEVLNKI